MHAYRLLFALFCASAASAAPLTEPRQVEALLRMHVEAHRSSPGIVVGIIDQGQRRLHAHGHDGRGQPVHGQTLFEIGSITKLFTARLLADAVLRGELRLDSRLGEVVGERAPGLDPEVAAITLESLAAHSSGLPRLPSSGAMLARGILRLSDPYRGSSEAELYRALARLSRDDLAMAGRFGYSNFGSALLGHAVAARAGSDYATLLQIRAIGGLDLTLSADAVDRGRLARGHRDNGRVAAHWILDAYAPAGGLLGSAVGLLDFAEQQLVSPNAADRLMREPVVAFGEQIPRAVGLGWIMQSLDGATLYWHNGGTGGFRSFLGIVPERGQAVVVLANSAREVDSLGLHLLGGGPAPEAQGSRWWWVLATLALVLLAPANLLLAALRQQLGRTPGWKMLSAMAAAAFILIVFGKIGAWRELPFALWWISALLCVATSLALLSRLDRVDWQAGSPWQRRGEQLYFVLLLLLLVPALGL